MKTPIVTFWMIVYTFTCCQLSVAQTFDDHIEKALQFEVKLKDYQRAVEEYSLAIELDPSDAYAHYSRARCNFQLKNFQEAQFDFENAAELDSNLYVDGYLNSGSCWTALAMPAKALTDLSKVIRKSPDNDEAYQLRGAARMDLKDNYGAIDDLNKAIELNPVNYSAFRYRGILNYRLKNYQAAISDLSVIPHLKHSELAVRGDSFRKLGMLQDACNDYRSCVELGGPEIMHEYIAEYCN